MNSVKKIINKFISMKTAMVLLGLLLIACIIGSVLPQCELEAYYLGYYSKTVSHLILLLSLDDVFHCWWFVVLTVLLCINLLGCNLIHFPVLLKRLKEGFTPEKRLSSWDGNADVVIGQDPEKFFSGLGFGKTITTKDSEGNEVRYAVRNKIGIWGAWLTHFGMLIIIVGFSFGQMATVKYTVYGVPGQTKPVEDTPYALTINDFNILLREDETVEQYVANVTVTDTRTGESRSGETSVNHPAKLFGMQVYQNSTGWAAIVSVIKDGQVLQQETLCAGEHLPIFDFPGLVVAYNAFYPDYYRQMDGTPASASSALNNPGYLYTLYYQNDILGMNVLTSDQKITVEGYEIVFTDPQSYTLLQLKRDPYTWLAMVGGIIMLAALFIAFYMRTEEIWAVKQADGSWKVAGYSRKGSVLFKDKIAEAANKA